MAHAPHPRPLPHCCYIDPAQHRSCRRPATWIIKTTTPGADPYDDTAACDAHLGDLLTDGATHAVSPLAGSGATLVF